MTKKQINTVLLVLLLGPVGAIAESKRSPAADEVQIKLVTLSGSDSYPEYTVMAGEFKGQNLVLRCTDPAWEYIQVKATDGTYKQKTIRYSLNEIFIPDARGPLHTRVEGRHFRSTENTFEKERGFLFGFRRKEECNKIAEAGGSTKACIHFLALSKSKGQAAFLRSECP